MSPLVLCLFLAGPAAPSSEFLIVARRDDLPTLAEFVEHKRRQVTTSVVALEVLLSSFAGRDDSERLKAALYDTWRRGTRSVLLVGDADRLPVRFMTLDRTHEAACHVAFYPSDLYFADVATDEGAFDDWNMFREGLHADYFGEVRGEHGKDSPINADGVSYRPELALGRWPARSTPEVAALVKKSLAFESRQESIAEPTALFVHVGGWVDAREHHLHMGGELSSTYTCSYLHGEPGDAETLQSARAALLLRPTLVFHSGHGTERGFEGSLGTKDLDSFPPGGPQGVAFSVGCSTAVLTVQPPYEPYLDRHGENHQGTNAGQKFASPPPAPSCYQAAPYERTSFGEESLRHPAGFIAYIGCATGAQPCALSLAEGFCLRIGRGRCTVGIAWKEALSTYVDREHLASLKPTASWYPPSIFFQGMKFNLLGDPTLRLP